MHNVTIKPGEYVGPLKLGMPETEINHILNDLEYSFSVLTTSYTNSSLTELEISNDRTIAAVLEGYNIDLFQTKVEDLIPKLNEISPYAINNFYSEGCQYDFPELGLRLWRSIELYSKDVENLPEDEKEERADKLYFETFVIYPSIK
ncbi:hypothetical protein J45TS6_35440 [Paenibacillus sp. J45TS6]|uniref:hypothetical protein n=1 Tax=unclassified Paenibacillus TaxID=185978 RepID=UPI00135B9864|nr:MULTISPECIES: hypothetical protein [unclassified Paenibacillus]GIP45085.1 hypothetical protein J45TS6_35440 [Paenibacillus sp. J45TS6]